MPNLVNAYVLYNGTTGQYVGGEGQTISINCERLQAFSPRPVWLKRFLAPGDGTVILYEPTFYPTSAELLDSNTLLGYWLEQDQQDVMIDATTLTAFQTACDACCGEVPAIITNRYGGSPTAFTPPTATTYCLTRTDSGSAGDHDAAAAAYVGQYIGTMRLTSNVSGTSLYQFESYTTPIALGDDVITSGAC